MSFFVSNVYPKMSFLVSKIFPIHGAKALYESPDMALVFTKLMLHTVPVQVCLALGPCAPGCQGGDHQLNSCNGGRQDMTQCGSI